MREILLLGAAGAVGTVSRWAVSGWAYRLAGTGFPWGTLVVNVIGCFLLGLVMEAGLLSDLIPATARTAIAVGFLGAFTTFSTFGYESVRVMEDGAWWLAFGNLVANVGLGFPAVWSGIKVAQLVLGGR